MSAPNRTDVRSPAYRAAGRISAAHAHRPATDHNGLPILNRPAPSFEYGPDGLLEQVTEEPPT